MTLLLPDPRPSHVTPNHPANPVILSNEEMVPQD